MNTEDEILNIPNQIGTLSLDLDGKILKSSGEWDSDNKAAQILFQMLQDTNSLVKCSGKTDPFKRLTVVFQNHSFVVTITNNSVIHVLKRKA